MFKFNSQFKNRTHSINHIMTLLQKKFTNDYGIIVSLLYFKSNELFVFHYKKLL
jgi:hypothetical protein